ncbi:MAG TPA: hypothetical protein VM008_06245 [Phycisphaerae bacterium]|nr:hypothetical protein [Phycisphaerae bacterium]
MAGRSAKRTSGWKQRKERLIEALESRILLTGYSGTDTFDSGPGAFEIQELTTVATATTYIRLDSTGANIQIYNASTPTGTPMTFPVGSVSSINVSPTTGNDLLVVDYSNGDPVPSGGISYTGGGSSAGNTLQIIGASTADAFTLHAGSVVHGSGTVTYSNMLNLTLGTGAFTTGDDLNLLDVKVNTQTVLNATTIEHIGQLTVNPGGTATLSGFFGNMIVNGSVQLVPDGTNAATCALNNLLLAGSTNNWSGQFDLTNNKLIVETTAGNKAATLATIRNQVLYGMTHSTGIVSTALPAGTLIAVIDAAMTTLTAFGGVAIDANSILIGPELAGDADVSGNVDLTDLSAVLNHFGAMTPDWTSGNFDYTATVNLTDLSYVLNNFGASIANPTGATPAAQPAAGSQETEVPTDLSAAATDSSSSVPGTILTSAVAIPVGAEAGDEIAPSNSTGQLLPDRVIVPTGLAAAGVPAPITSVIGATTPSVPAQISAQIAILPTTPLISHASSVSLRPGNAGHPVHSTTLSPRVQAGHSSGIATYAPRGHRHWLAGGDRKHDLDPEALDV